MNINLKLYDNPKLTREVEPGQLIEALPNSYATQTILGDCDSIDYSPTGVIGYIIGTRKNYETIHYRDQIVTGGIDGVVVERLTNVGKGYRGAIGNLVFWGPDSDYTQVYCVIGEIEGTTQPVKDELTEILEDGYVLLSEEEKEQIQTEIRDLMRKRLKRDYVFATPDGQKFRLNEIVLKLEEI